MCAFLGIDVLRAYISCPAGAKAGVLTMPIFANSTAGAPYVDASGKVRMIPQLPRLVTLHASVPANPCMHLGWAFIPCCTGTAACKQGE